jgi:hypothetical protein
MTRAWIMLAITAACGSPRSDAAPAPHGPSIEVAPLAADRLCITRGAVADGKIIEPTVRGFALGAGGDAAELTFVYQGDTDDARELASGQLRRQLGLKLRAQDSCNVVYVMWRLDPRPAIDVSVKYNPTKHSHAECGADGYTKVKPYKKPFVTAFEYKTPHKLRAEIVGDELSVWIDGKLLWQGRLPDSARDIHGPAGIRSDNVKLELISLAAPHSEGKPPTCKREGGD